MHVLGMRRVRRGRGGALACAGAFAAIVAAGPPAAADCTKTITGSPPLTDMATGQLYKGFQGGLYPGGLGAPPAAHLAAALTAASKVTPVNGRIFLIAIGISHTRHEFSTPPNQLPSTTQPRLPRTVKTFTFKSRADLDKAKSSSVILVDGAQGAADSVAWADPAHTAWGVLGQRLTAAGMVSPSEVRVAWIKLAALKPTQFGPFPGHALALQDDLTHVVQNAKALYPNLEIAFISSRTRAYSAHGEPESYENGYGMKWLIESQINGDPALNHDSAMGPVLSPLLMWGPYLWADGVVPRSDGLTWICNTVDPFVSPFASDVRAFAASPVPADYDYSHPGGGGVKKVGEELLAFFKTSPLTTPWFLRPSTTVPSVTLSTGNVTTGQAPLTVTFTGTSNTPTQSILEYAFNFDDGTVGLGASRTKTFVVPGVYAVRMTASDSLGNTATKIATITVTP